jgi:hypothetical protein
MTNPTQNLVDAFPMSNGRTIDDPNSGYDPAKPYNNRDPRLAMTVLFNGSSFVVNDKTSTIETFAGGTDGPESYPNASPTGYYLKKFLLPHAVWDGRTVNITRTWILIRFAELYLNYAESRNEAYGPDAEVYAALRALRLRAGLRPSDVQAGLNQEQMRKLIQNERRIELAFEEHRFFDIRRWKLFDDPEQKSAIQNIRAVKIIRNEDGSITINPNHKLQERTFSPKMYFYPIPMDEIQKNKNLTQNPMW